MGKKGERAEQNYPKHPFLLPTDEIVTHLETNLDLGLTSAQVQQYQTKYGPNRLEGDGGVAWYAILGKQISNAMILVSLVILLFKTGVHLLTFVTGVGASYGTLLWC